MKTLSWLASILVFTLFAIVPGQLRSQEIATGDSSEIAHHMHEHRTRITTIRSFIIKGNLDGVREPASWLAEHETVSGLPAHFESYVEMMRSYAREIVVAPDLKSAAMSVSSMARTCGNCHLVNHVDLKVAYDPVPADGASTISHMKRHQWAMERLWEGLISPSDTAWWRGADMLVGVPLRAAEVTNEATEVGNSAALDELARRVHMLGGQGTITRTPDARSALYGELLGLCADCHTRLGRGP